EGTCQPTGGNTWQPTIAPDQVGNVPPPQGPLAYPTVGYSYLYDENGHSLPNGKAPIEVDPQSGRLSYRYDNLAPGIYQLKAFVGYKGKDSLSRVYNMILAPNTQTLDDSITFQLKASDAFCSF